MPGGNIKKAIPRCVEELPYLLGMVKRYRKYPNSGNDERLKLTIVM
jgi:hypothetical protein